MLPLLATLALFGASALLALFGVAAEVPDPATDPGGFAALLAGLWGQWWAFGAAIALGATKILGTFGSGWIPWLGTRIGKLVQAVVFAFIGTFGSALLGGADPDWALLGQAVLAAVAAIGSHSAAKNAIQGNKPKPILEWPPRAGT